MNIFDDVGFELRDHVGPVAKWSLIVLIAVVVVLTAAATIFLTIAYQTRPPSMDEERVPTAEYGYATVQVLDCLEKGPACAEYTDSKEYLQASPGITYTPVRGDGPGTSNGDGTRTVRFTSSTPRRDYVAFAGAVTGDGALTAAGMTTSDFEDGGDGDAVTFTYTDPSTKTRHRGTFTFTTAKSQKVLASVTSQPAGGP